MNAQCFVVFLVASWIGLQQNRPYTALVIYENLHQQVKKPALIRILDELTEEGHLQSKGQSIRGVAVASTRAHTRKDGGPSIADAFALA